MKNAENNRRSSLSTLQARTALHEIENNADILDSMKNIHKAAKNILFALIKQFPNNYPKDIRKVLFAFILANVGKKAVKTEQITAVDYLVFVAKQKQYNEKNFSDYGAFGDLFEILVRLALVKNMHLINVNMLNVKYSFACDIISKKYGKIEVGHNGKSLTFGTLFDYMAGDYDGVIYGMFSDIDKQEIYNYCVNGQVEKAINYVAEYSVLWTDKYAFQYDMDNLTRGKGITEKGGDIQVVYNSGKYSAFQSAIENGTFKTLKERLTRA